LKVVQDRAIVTMAGMVYGTAPFSMTWMSPNPDFKVRPFFDAGYFRNG